MNRRNFFQTLLAGAAAIFLPKSKKAELVFDDDKTYTFGQDDDTFFVYNPGTFAEFSWCKECNCFHPPRGCGFTPKETQNG